MTLDDDLDVRIPSLKDIDETNREYLNRIYEGLEPGDFRGQIERCCEYLKIDVPDLEDHQIRTYRYSIQKRFLAQYHLDLFEANEIEENW